MTKISSTKTLLDRRDANIWNVKSLSRRFHVFADMFLSFDFQRQRVARKLFMAACCWHVAMRFNNQVLWRPTGSLKVIAGNAQVQNS